MKTIRIHRHPDCRRCARLAQQHRRLDWLGHVDDSTAPPPGRAPVAMGEIAVHDLRTGELLEGIAAVRAIARAVPLYWAMLPLLWVPAVVRRADAQARGCGVP